ncbi:hypothetical protein [Halomontanus rarus]|uniref:hypothetical protein n=1 Tax=Halomontanus rarus TaxID=3034020 RepID=UPI00307C4AF6
MATNRSYGPHGVDSQEIIDAVEYHAKRGNVDAGEGGVPPTKIAERIGITKTTAQKRASKLADEGRLERAWGFSPEMNQRQSFLPVDREIRTDGGSSRCWDGEECPGCGGELQQQDRYNVACLDCEGAWGHSKDDDHHYLQTASGYVVTKKPRTGDDREIRTDGGESRDGTKQCPRCGSGPEGLLFDPQPHPKSNRFVCCECDHEWYVDTDTNETEADR